MRQVAVEMTIAHTCYSSASRLISADIAQRAVINEKGISRLSDPCSNIATFMSRRATYFVHVSYDMRFSLLLDTTSQGVKVLASRSSA